MKQLAQLVVERLESSLGPGFESQVPPILAYYFSFWLRRAYKDKGSPYPLKISPLDLQMAKSDGHHLRDHGMPQSKQRTGCKKSNVDLFVLGPDC